MTGVLGLTQSTPLCYTVFDFMARTSYWSFRCTWWNAEPLLPLPTTLRIGSCGTRPQVAVAGQMRIRSCCNPTLKRGLTVLC